jgi:hypothetical protein
MAVKQSSLDFWVVTTCTTCTSQPKIYSFICLFTQCSFGNGDQTEAKLACSTKYIHSVFQVTKAEEILWVTSSVVTKVELKRFSSAEHLRETQLLVFQLNFHVGYTMSRPNVTFDWHNTIAYNVCDNIACLLFASLLQHFQIDSYFLIVHN